MSVAVAHAMRKPHLFALKAAQSSRSTALVATAMLLCSLLMAGGNGILASAVSLPSFETVVLRATLGAGILGIMLLSTRRPLQILEHKKDAVLLVLAGAALGGDWLFLFEAYGYAGVGMSTILCYCAPILVMILSPLLFREKLTAPKVAGFVVVVAGAVLVNSAALSGGASPYGIACGLASAVCFAVMMILNKKVTYVEGVEKVFVEMASAAGVALLYAVFAKGVSFVVLPTDVLPIAALGVTTAIGNYLYLKAMGSLPVQRVAVLGYLEPLSAVALSALFLGEALAPLQLVGAACIILGALVCEMHFRGFANRLRPAHA